MFFSRCPTAALFVALALLFVCSGCGGGGGSDPSDGGGSQRTFYVRTLAGDDGNAGLMPQEALRTIGEAVRRIESGDTVIVGPGTYFEAIIDPVGGSMARATHFLADPSGVATEDEPGRVVVNAVDAFDDRDPPRRLPAFRISRAEFVTIDGFVFTRGGGAGIQVRATSSDITIQNCEVFSNAGDGILLQDSSRVLVFNNLVYDNASRGIVVGGMAGTTLLNNTLTRNSRGVSIVTRDEMQSRGTYLRNNIMQGNETNFTVDTFEGFLDEIDSDFNLVFPSSYVPDSIMRPTDVNDDAEFVDSRNDNFRLSEQSAGDPANSPGVDGGVEEQLDPGPRADFGILRERTTASDGALDLGPVNLGYHYRTDADIPDPRPPILFVRALVGDDANNGRTPQSALQSLRAAASRAIAGDTIIVGPGAYDRLLEPSGGTEQNPISFVADPTGEATGDAAGDVVIDGAGLGSVVRITDASFLNIDGFMIVGGRTAGVQVRGGSSQIAIRNCEISGTEGDGILVQDSSQVLLFNNLIYDNTRRGISIAGSPRVSVINNTVAFNADRGIYVTTLEIDGVRVGSPDAFVRNNITQENGGAGLQVSIAEPSSLPGFDSGYNLVFPTSYEPEDIRTETDINEDAMFARVALGDFRLLQPRVSPSAAIDAGVEENAPFGPVADFSTMHQRTTSPNQREDTGPLDLGYHYPR
jgi:parallel beta-helix repeat protein